MLSRRGLSLPGALTALFILVLLAAVGLLLTERNQRRYFLRVQAGLLVVDRGLPLPYGHAPFRPTEARLAKAYRAIRLPAGVALPAEESFDDRADLDQRLGDLLLQAAKARLTASDEGHLEEGMEYLSQIDALAQLSAEQKRLARQLGSEVAFGEATDKLARALAALREVQELLRQGAESANAHARDSAELRDRLALPIEALQRAARGGGILPAEESALPPAPAAAMLPSPHSVDAGSP